MPRYPQIGKDDGKDFTLVIDKFNRGVMSIYDDTRLPKDAVVQAINMYLDQDGIWTVRPGSEPYGQTLTTPIDGATSFVKYNSNGTMDTYLAVIDNGALKISQDGGSWTTISGNTWTTGYDVQFKQIQSRLWIANGYDALSYYNITSGTLVTFTSKSAPTLGAPTRTGLTTGPYNAYYKATTVNAIGESTGSAEVSVSGGINKTRDTWTTGTDYLTLTVTPVAGATRTNIYYSDSSGTEVYLDSIDGSQTSYIDYGTAIPNLYQELPTTNTTTGPKVGNLALSGNRLWATKNPDYPYRVVWGGVGQYLGSLNPFDGGGYVDLNLGSSERPEAVTHFRDGKGNALATVLTSDPNGTGSTWHIALSTITTDTLQIVIPQAYSQQGAIGTRSPRGVIEYDNAVYYPSPKGFQSLGSKQSILNVLVTTDVSGNVRPSVKGISNAYSSKIAGYARDGRLYYAIPYGSSTNNQIWVMDLERRGSWSLYWTLGVKQFLEYTDSSGIIHFLAIPTSGSKLIEIGANVTGDSGDAFSTNLLSGLIHWDKDHTTFAYIDKVFCEIADPIGTVNFTVAGTQKGKAFNSVGSITITDSVSVAGMGADLFGDFLYGDSGSAGASFAQSSVKKYIRVNKVLNNIQWQFTTDTISAQYKPMEIVIKGRILPVGPPSLWKP